MFPAEDFLAVVNQKDVRKYTLLIGKVGIQVWPRSLALFMQILASSQGCLIPLVCVEVLKRLSTSPS